MKVLVYASKKAIELLHASDVKENYDVIRYDEYTPFCRYSLKAKRDSYENIYVLMENESEGYDDFRLFDEVEIFWLCGTQFGTFLL